jgi:hypothetical protein
MPAFVLSKYCFSAACGLVGHMDRISASERSELATRLASCLNAPAENEARSLVCSRFAFKLNILSLLAMTTMPQADKGHAQY